MSERALSFGSTASWSERFRPGYPDQFEDVRQTTLERRVTLPGLHSVTRGRVATARQVSQLADRRGGQPSPGRMLCDTETKFCRVVSAEDQVEAT